MKLCQGPKCHTYDTKDRLRGPKGMKVPQTRRRSSFYYLGGNAWYKTFDWDNSYENRTYYTYNRVTQEQRPLTEQQYRDSNYDLNER